METADQVYRKDLIPFNTLHSFCFPQLRAIYLMYALTNNALLMIAATCPHLRYLDVSVLRESDDVVVCNFNHLRRLNFSISNSQSAHETNIYINHMTLLVELIISCVNFHSLHVGSQIPMLEKNTTSRFFATRTCFSRRIGTIIS